MIFLLRCTFLDAGLEAARAEYSEKVDFPPQEVVEVVVGKLRNRAVPDEPILLRRQVSPLRMVDAARKEPEWVGAVEDWMREEF